jgi:hypothetical protein
MYRFIVTLCITLLVGCGGNVKPVACTGIDWTSLGHATAISGKSVRTFDSYRDQCGSNLEEGAIDSYLDGYTKAVIEYCTFDNGYSLGSLNRSVEATCPIEVRSGFERGYAQGARERNDKLSELDREREEHERNKMRGSIETQQ